MIHNASTPKRKTIGYFPSGADYPNANVYQTTYGHRFVNDVRLHVMPIGGKTSERENFAITLTTSETMHYEIISEGFHTTRHVRHHGKDFERIISEFIADSSMHLALHGRVFYEITREDQRSEVNKNPVESNTVQGEAFRLHLIPGRVKRKGSSYQQYVPSRERSDYPFDYVSVPKDLVFEIEIPPSLGGCKEHQNMISMLAITSETLPPFVHEGLHNNISTTDFETKDFIWTMEVERARATVKWGTILGLNSDEHTLEYFRVYRHLRFLRAMALLREYIVSQMNGLLVRLGFSCRILINGLPNSDEIDVYINQLARGEIGFDDVLNAVKY